MRWPRMNTQRWMVAIVFLAIFSWAGSIVGPVVVHRWSACRARADAYEAEARSSAALAVMYDGQSKPYQAGNLRERAHNYQKESQKYRRALVNPWEFWTLGDY